MASDRSRTPTVRRDLEGRLRAAGCVFAEDEAAELLDVATGPEHLEQLTRRRLTGEPLEQVVGRVRWAGTVLRVSPGVFVPRARTAHLADVATRAARAARGGADRGGADRGAVVVDLCCGVGAVAAYVAARLPGARVHAADLDPVAVACARENLAPHVGVWTGDLYDALPRRLRGQVDVLAVNAPYVPSAEIALLPREARDHEPLVALDGGADGLDVHLRVLASAARWLSPAGVVVAEVAAAQVPAYVAMAEAAAMVATAVAGQAGTTAVRAAPDQRVGSISYQV